MLINAIKIKIRIFSFYSVISNMFITTFAKNGKNK